MKKVLSFLIFGILLIVLITPEIVSAQAPATCIKLKNDIKWTGSIDAKTNCINAATNDKYCLFKSGRIVGEGSFAACGGAAAPVRCDTAPGPWTHNVDHLDQNADCITGIWGMIAILNTLYTATNWIFIVLIILVGLFIIFGGITIATAGGDPNKVNSGKNYMLYALIGLVIAFLSKALPTIVTALLGV
jgi:hypothetical protein